MEQLEPSAVELVEPGLVRVPQRTATLPPATRTNAYLVDTGMGWLVVDPGSADDAELSIIEQALRDHADGDALGVFVTHHHADHVAGAPALAARLDVPLWCHREALRRWRGADGGAPWPPGVHVEELDGDGWFGEDVRVLSSPGHAPGHLSLLVASGSLVAGDVVAGVGTIVVAPPDGSMTDYLATLERLATLTTGAVYPSHGPAALDGAALLRWYHAHRLARERRVIDALDVEPRSLGEVTAAAYAEVPPALLPLAQWQCVAHLDRLAELGIAVERAGRWARC